MKEKFGAVIKFLKETRAETKKVIWPDRKYVTTATIIILVLVFITGVYVMAVDYGFMKLFAFLIK